MHISLESTRSEVDGIPSDQFGSQKRTNGVGVKRGACVSAMAIRLEEELSRGVVAAIRIQKSNGQKQQLPEYEERD
jgi:hypothetical protein